MAKILQGLKTLKMCKMQHAEHLGKDHTTLAGLDQNLLFYGPPYILMGMKMKMSVSSYSRAPLI